MNLTAMFSEEGMRLYNLGLVHEALTSFFNALSCRGIDPTTQDTIERIICIIGEEAGMVG